MEGQLSFGVLGPLAVARETEAIDIPRRKERQLLAVLLLEANQPVSTDRLVEALWADQPPAKPLSSLRACVSNIRKALPSTGDEGSVVVTEQGGYRLRVDDGAIDAHRFEQLVNLARTARESGDSAGAAASLDEALGLVRGEPLADMTYDEFAQREIARLAELIISSEELRAQLAVELGQAEAWLPRITELVSAHPLRERLQATHMTALYHLGRQAEALRSYQDHRQSMIEELGIEPASELQELEAKILAQDRSLLPEPDEDRPEPRRPAASHGSPSQAPTEPATTPGGAADTSISGGDATPGASPTIVGRTAELDLLKQVATAAPGAAFVVGESGSGKSTLIGAFLSELESAGWRTVRGLCLDDDGVPPLWPWRQIVRDLDLAHTVSLSIEDESSRFDVFDDMASGLLESTGSGPIAVFLDDLQWADDNSLRLLNHVGRRLRAEPLLLIGAARTTPGALSATAATWIELTNLTVDDVGQLVENKTGQPCEPALAAELWERTGGNAYFATELIDFARHFGEDVRPDLEIPSHVRQLVRQRIDVLSKRTAELLAIAALEIQNFSPAVIADVVDDDPESVLADLKPAIDAGIITADRDAFGQFRFDHAITRETLQADIDPTALVNYHAALGRSLEARVGQNAEQYATQLSRHYGIGAAAGTAEDAIRWATVAAERAAATWSYRDGVVHLQRALDADRYLEEPNPRGRAETMLSLGRFSRTAGDVELAEEALLGAYRLADELDDADLRARAALAMSEGMGAGHWRWYWNPGNTAISAMSRALEKMPETDSSLRLKLMAQLAADGLEAIPLAERESLLDEAAAMAERLGDVLDIIRIAGYRRAALGWTWSPGRALEVDREVLAFFSAEGMESGELAIRSNVMADLATLGDLAAMRVEFDELRAKARLRGSLAWRYYATQWEIFFGQLTGRWDEANRWAEKALDPVSGLGEDLGVGIFYQMQVTKYHQGQMDTMIETLRAGMPVVDRPLFPTVLLNSLVVDGQTDEAMELLQQFDPLKSDLDEIGGRLTVALGTEVLALLDLTERLDEAIEFLLPAAKELCIGAAGLGGLIFFGPIRYYLALAMVARHRFDEAAEQIAEARAVMGRLEARPQLAKLDYVEAELIAGRDGMAAARPRFEEIRSAAEDLQMAGLVALVDRALGRSGPLGQQPH